MPNLTGKFIVEALQHSLENIHMILTRKSIFKLECENEKIHVFHKVILKIFGTYNSRNINN